jgi:thioredoxin reductase
VIVGSGPGGLSAALEAKAAGLDCVILEQGTMADSVRKYPRHKLLLAEPVKIPLYGDLWVADAPKETLLQIWETVVRGAGLQVRTDHRVEDVTRQGALLRVEGKGFRLFGRRVILALGRRGTPRRLGVPGEESERVFYEIVEMEAFRGRHVLVVGGGDSALESAVGLSNQDGADVTLSHRGDSFDRAKERNVAKLEAAEAAGRVRVLRGSTLARIDADTVTIRTATGNETIRCDNVIVRVGGEPPTAFLERVGIRTVRKELPLEEAREAVHA